MNLDAILELDRGDETVSGAIADIILLPGGRVAWRIWPDDADTPYVVSRLTAHGHVFVVSSEPTDAEALARAVAERYPQ